MTRDTGTFTFIPPKDDGKTDWRRHRRFNRYKLDIRVVITREISGKEERLNGRCRHLGEGGLGAVLAGELPMAEVVGLEFTLPGDSEPMRMRAAVRQRHGFHHGFEFLTLSVSQLDAIRKAAKALPPAE